MGLGFQRQRAVDIIIRPGSEHVQLRVVTDAQKYLRDTKAEMQIIPVFTNRREAAAALRLSRLLATSPDIHILIVCPVVVPSLFSPPRIQRFIQFLKATFDVSADSALERVRIVVWPCANDQDVVEQLHNARSIVVVRRRWWRPWGKCIPESEIVSVNGISLFL